MRLSRLTGIPHIVIVALGWLAYGSLLVILPVKYGSLKAVDTAFAMTLFVAISLLVALVIDHVTNNPRQAAGVHAYCRDDTDFEGRQAGRLIVVGMILSFAGFGMLLFDKVLIQHIDFSQGIAIARELWRREGEIREGISSVFSLLGYLFGFTFIAAAALAHLRWESLRPAIRAIALLGTALLVLANSLLSGGRSIILLQIAVFVATGVLRMLAGLKVFPGRVLRAIIWSSALLTLAIGYTVYVFSERAAAVGVDPSLYSVEIMAFLGGAPTDRFQALTALPEGLSGVSQFAVIAGAYLTHSFGTFESIMDMVATPGSATFVFFRSLLARLGLGDPIVEGWILSGRFLSLPGVLWYDFGWLGMCVGAALLGVLLGLIRPLTHLTQFPASVTGCCVAIIVTGLISPLLLAPDLLAFPLMLIGFLQLGLIAWLADAQVSWLPSGKVVRVSVQEFLQ